MNLKEYKDYIKRKKVAVIGLGISNIPLVSFLIQNDVCVVGYDKKDAKQLGETYNTLINLGVKLILGEQYLKNIEKDTEIIFKTPGLRYDVPELLDAKKNGAKITSEMELFCELCPAPIIAVTGSDGKTTTTTLISEILKAEGYKCFIGGNIGTPLIGELDNITDKDKVVLELSSFQLHSMKICPKVAVITNVTPNHLDWHTDYEEYITAKKNIFLKQSLIGRVVLNYDNEITKSFADDAKKHIYFSRNTEIEDGICLNKEKTCIVINNKDCQNEILKIDDIKLPGWHNVENYMAAIAATYDIVSLKSIIKVAKEFGGVPHRIEFVRELDGVKYYNDSIASSPARTTAGLKSFNQKVILIAGGYDKKIPFNDFGYIVNDFVKELVLVGATSEKIENSVISAANYGKLPIYKYDDFEEAVIKAKNLAEKGDIVILSPACASFDLFKNFEERGLRFKSIVLNF